MMCVVHWFCGNSSSALFIYVYNIVQETAYISPCPMSKRQPTYPHVQCPIKLHTVWFNNVLYIILNLYVSFWVDYWLYQIIVFTVVCILKCSLLSFLYVMYFISVWTPGRIAAATAVANGDPNKQTNKQTAWPGCIKRLKNCILEWWK